ncbi:SDR family NAD(P)-dependent oxidoreductase [Almyronema epifaneia]|uniref:SDR family NAD(P)-dependent oxidoreductase n=1 Tax=Almyronema epifaneia S1 TaxID=2991925 RepID=A0ABW6IDT1_9CYAN
MINLAGKVILVTGASRGIGAAIAQTLGAAHADVIVHYGHDPKGASQVAAAIASAYVVQADLAVVGAATDLWSAAIAWKGHIDVVINNAGIAPAAGVAPQAGVDADFATWSQAWQKTLQVNLIAVADICREAILHFQTQGGGTLINIASRAAFRGDDPEYMHYAASKGGVISLTRSIARGYGRQNILAYAIAPGFVRTEMSEAFVQKYGEETLTRDIPLGQIASPQDVANVAAFLASGLAPHATGTTIDINGASYVR